MDNPGLKTHGAEPFLKVSGRRYADVMGAPTIDSTEQGLLYNDQLDPLMPNNNDATTREDVTQGPPMAGGNSTLPVPATNGEATPDRSVNLRQHMAGLPATQVPGEIRTKRSNPLATQQHALEDQQEQLAQGIKDRLRAVQEQDGRNENPAYEQAQREIQDKLNLRRAHPLHQAAVWDEEEDEPEYGMSQSDVDRRVGRDVIPTMEAQGWTTVHHKSPEYDPPTIYDESSGREYKAPGYHFEKVGPGGFKSNMVYDFHPINDNPEDQEPGWHIMTHVPLKKGEYPDPDDATVLPYKFESFARPVNANYHHNKHMLELGGEMHEGEGEWDEPREEGSANPAYLKRDMGMGEISRKPKDVFPEGINHGLFQRLNAYDPDDPLAPPSGGGSRRPRTEDHGLGDDGWHRFGLMHPDGYDDNQNITIAVKHHGDVTSSPFGNKGDIRPQFEVRVGKGETQVMPSNGGGYPFWGSALNRGFHTSHRDVAQGVAASLGSDAYDIDLPLHQRSMYDNRDEPMTEQNYPWAMGEGQHEWPVLGDGGGSVPYSDPEKEFLREHADRLAKAGIEDYELNQTGEPSTLVNLDHHEGEGPEPETKPHPRYGAFAKLAGEQPEAYEVHPDEIGYLGARDFYHIPLRERPWEVSDQADDFDARVRDIMDSAQHEGIREPLDVLHGYMHDGAHRWEAARRLNIPVRIVRRGAAMFSLASFIEMYRTGALTDEELERITQQNAEARKWLDEEAERAGEGYKHEQAFYRQNPGARAFEQETHYENPEIRPHPEAQARGEQPREFTPTESEGYSHVFSIPEVYRDDHPIELHMRHPGYEDTDGLGMRPHYQYRWVYNGQPVHEGEAWGPVRGEPDMHDMARTVSNFASYDGDRVVDDPGLEDEENHDLRGAGSAYHHFVGMEGERLGMAGAERDPDYPEYDGTPQLIRHTAATANAADWAEALRREAGTANPYRPGLEVHEYEGEPGNPDHITRVERGMIPIDWVRNMLGARGERPGEHRNRQDQDWEDFKQALTTAGDSGIHAPIFVTVDYGKQPQLAEGNHRRDAYAELGATHVPAEIRYFGHSERQGTVGERAEDRMRHMGAAPYEIHYESRGSYQPRWIPGGGDPAPRENYHTYRAVMPDGQSLGRLDFSTVNYERPEAHVEWVESHQPGVGSALLDKLYQDHPDHQVYLGMQTDEGGPFVQRYLGKRPHLLVRTAAAIPVDRGDDEPMQHEGRCNPGLKRMAAPSDESDEDFWARQPDVVHGISDSADQTGQAFLEPGDVESDLDDMIPENTLLREHAHVMRNGFRWDGDLHNPRYEREHWRETVDSEGRPTNDQEGHVIERNTHVLSPQLDEDADPLSYPWMHTYHPAGTDGGLVSGHNTAQGATRAAIQLGLYGTQHPRSQELLKGYRYVGSGEPYDPSIELPHEAALRMRA